MNRRKTAAAIKKLYKKEKRKRDYVAQGEKHSNFMADWWAKLDPVVKAERLSRMRAFRQKDIEKAKRLNYK